MKILNSVLGWAMQKRMHQIELFMKFPHQVQEELLEKLVNTAKNTEWGKKYDYKSINNLDEFKNRIPIQDYDSLREYILRVKHGEQNVLWPSEIKWFAKSSGTTSDKSKFIPVSKEALEDCHYKGGKDMLALYYKQYPESMLYSGKALVLGGSSEVNQFSKDSYYGDLSSIIIKNLPYWAEYVRIPSKETALLPKWEEKIEKVARESMHEDVTNITGVPTWLILLMKRILEISGKSNMLEVWPNMELYIHGGVSFKPYQTTFQNFFPSDKVNYLETYNASEGFFGIQDRFENNPEKEMLLMLDYGIYYEFMPMDEYGKENPKTLTLHEVKIGENYAIIISTNGGLWRYMIGDTIKFTSLDPFRIIVSGRTKYFINAFGEEVIADNTDKAIAHACEKTNAIVKEYSVAPIYLNNKEKGAHEWVIEFDKQPENIEFFNSSLDTYLKAINSDYEAKRYQDLALTEPKIHIAPEGTFYLWLKEKGKLGGQHKVPRLSNNRDVMDSLLKLIS